MLLHSNQNEIESAMAINKTDVDEDLMKTYKKKMNDILRHLYPSAAHDTTRKRLMQMELWTGHEVIADSIFLNSRSISEVKEDRVFSNDIPIMQWDRFVETEKKRDGSKPSLDAIFRHYSTPSKRKARAKKAPPPPEQTGISEIEKVAKVPDIDNAHVEESK
jgi:hypothetical protein